MRTSLGFQFLPWKCTARHYRRRDGYFQQNELPKNCENQNSVIRNIENQEVNLLSKEELGKKIEVVEKELKSYTWRELETNGKFAKKR